MFVSVMAGAKRLGAKRSDAKRFETPGIETPRSKTSRSEIWSCESTMCVTSMSRHSATKRPCAKRVGAKCMDSKCPVRKDHALNVCVRNVHVTVVQFATKSKNSCLWCTLAFIEQINEPTLNKNVITFENVIMGGVIECVGWGSHPCLRPIFVIFAIKCDSFEQK